MLFLAEETELYSFHGPRSFLYLAVPIVRCIHLTVPNNGIICTRLQSLTE